MATSEEINTDTITEEEIFKHRLLLEEDDIDKNLTGFSKAFLKWANSLHEQTEEERTHTAEALQIQLFGLETLMKKSQLVQKRQEKEVEFYDKKHKEMEGKVDEATRRLKLVSVELEKSKETKKNKLEYDSMARIIKTLPSRQTLQGQISAVSKEVDAVQKKKEKLRSNLERKKKLVHVMCHSASETLRIIRAEDEANKKNQKSDKDASMEPSTSTPKMESHHEEEEEQEANQKDVSFDTLSDSVFECENIGEEEDASQKNVSFDTSCDSIFECQNMEEDDDYEPESGEIVGTSSERSQEDDALDDSFEKT